MAQNQVQFQKGLSILEFFQSYGNEEQCRATLEKIHWPNGYVCQECEHSSYCYLKSRKVYQCHRCHSQTSITSGTVFHSTKLPLTKWFLAMYLLSQSKNGISALELKRQIGVSYPTAFRLKHKLMQVMMERDRQKPLSGLIQADDAYLGGKRSGGKRGRGTKNKQPFLAAVKIDLKNHPREVKLSAVKAFTKKDVGRWAENNLSKEFSCVVTDGLSCFNALKDIVSIHIAKTIGVGKKSTDDPAFKWVNTVLGNVKNSIKGTYHANRKVYAGRYLAEFEYRFNRRYNLAAILPRLVYAAVTTPPLPGGLLKLAANC